MHAVNVRSLHRTLGLQHECIVIVVPSVIEAADSTWASDVLWPWTCPICTDTPQQYADKTSVTISMLLLGDNNI